MKAGLLVRGPWVDKMGPQGDLWPLSGSTRGIGKPTIPGTCMACLSGPARGALARGTHSPRPGVAVTSPCGWLLSLPAPDTGSEASTLYGWGPAVWWTLGVTLPVWSVVACAAEEAGFSVSHRRTFLPCLQLSRTLLSWESELALGTKEESWACQGHGSLLLGWQGWGRCLSLVSV